MKFLCLAALLSVATVVTTFAAEPIPPDLVGIWAVEGSQFRGDAIMKGSAIYFDVDGVGAIAGGDGSDVLGVRFVVTAYNPATHFINVDLTEYGKVIASEVLVYDPKEQIIFSAKDPKQRYRRRSERVSPEIRKGLGLEPRTQ